MRPQRRLLASKPARGPGSSPSGPGRRAAGGSGRRWPGSPVALGGRPVGGLPRQWGALRFRSTTSALSRPGGRVSRAALLISNNLARTSHATRAHHQCQEVGAKSSEATRALRRAEVRYPVPRPAPHVRVSCFRACTSFFGPFAGRIWTPGPASATTPTSTLAARGCRRGCRRIVDW